MVSSVFDHPYPLQIDHHHTMDLYAELMHSTLVLAHAKEKITSAPKKWSAHQMVNWSDVHKVSGHLPENLSHFNIAIPLLSFCPPTSLKPRVTQYGRNSFFQTSYSSHYNSMCFGSVRSGFPMNPIQLLASFLKFQRTVRTIGSQIFFLRSFEHFSSSLELMRFCLDNFESIELQNLAKPLHICVVVVSWSSLRNLAVRYLHIAQTIG